MDAKIKQMVPERPIVRPAKKKVEIFAGGCLFGRDRSVVVITRIIGR